MSDSMHPPRGRSKHKIKVEEPDTHERPWHYPTCRGCGAVLSNEEEARVHLAAHGGDKAPFKCIYCPAILPGKNNLRIHTRKHTGDRPFKCSQCDAAFAVFDSLHRHQRTHTGEKPFACERCDRRFSFASSLKRHMSNNICGDGEEATACDECSEVFTSQAAMADHFYNEHAPPSKVPRRMNYGCHLCKSRFVYHDNLESHLRRHANCEIRLECPDCFRSFLTEEELNDHRVSCAVHNGTQRFNFACKQCKRRFQTSRGLSRHALVHVPASELMKADAAEPKLTIHRWSPKVEEPTHHPQPSPEFIPPTQIWPVEPPYSQDMHMTSFVPNTGIRSVSPQVLFDDYSFSNELLIQNPDSSTGNNSDESHTSDDFQREDSTGDSEESTSSNTCKLPGITVFSRALF